MGVTSRFCMLKYSAPKENRNHIRTYTAGYYLELKFVEGRTFLNLYIVRCKVLVVTCIVSYYSGSCDFAYR